MGTGRPLPDELEPPEKPRGLDVDGIASLHSTPEGNVGKSKKNNPPQVGSNLKNL